MAQNRDSYHNKVIRIIRQNLMEISCLDDYMKLIYCLAHKDIMDNELADNLAKIASKTLLISPLEQTYHYQKLKKCQQTNNPKYMVYNMRTFSAIRVNFMQQ